MSDRETRIRERAYRLWIEQGQPDGRSDQHWTEAERLVDAEGAGAGLAVDPASTAAAEAGSSAGDGGKPRGRARAAPS